VSHVASLWTLVRWVHLLAAITWIGGQLFILLVLLPIARGALPRDERTLLFASVGRRYGIISWAALSLLIVTGVLNGERRSVHWTHLTDGSYGRILLAKLIVVAVVIVVTLVHALYFGRRITEIAVQAKAVGRDDPALAAERRRLQIVSGMLSGLNLLLNLVIVWLAAALVA
jgi:uncharacterized membrane protein